MRIRVLVKCVVIVAIIPPDDLWLDDVYSRGKKERTMLSSVAVSIKTGLRLAFGLGVLMMALRIPLAPNLMIDNAK